MDEAYQEFRSKEEILSAYQGILTKEPLLDATLTEITTLTRGNVKSQDTLRRSKVGSFVSSTIQQINNAVDRHTIYLTRSVKEDLERLAHKADKILRENIVLQTTPPLDVVPFEHVPIRHSYSFFGGRELRWGYGFHMNPFNEDGHSVTLASMPPHYSQSIHNHTVSEYCHILDSLTEGVYFPGGVREKIIRAKRHEILHFSATTPHTLRNPSDESNRNITFKQARALTDWKPASHLNKVKVVRARLIRGKIERINDKQTNKYFQIHDRFYNYTLTIRKLEKGTTLTDIHPINHFIFVVSGILEISHQNIRKQARKNDFIVIDKNTEYSLSTLTRCRLYSVVC